MKYFSKGNFYKNCTGTNKYYCDEFKTVSYDGWQYVRLIDDYIVFNDFRYSSTTSKHQLFCRNLFKTMGIIIDIEVSCPDGLQDLGSGIKYYENLIDSLEVLINKKGTRKSKNLERLAEIDGFKDKIRVLNMLI